MRQLPLDELTGAVPESFTRCLSCNLGPTGHEQPPAKINSTMLWRASLYIYIYIYCVCVCVARYNVGVCVGLGAPMGVREVVYVCA